MMTVTAFKSVPPFAQGLVRDLRVRWALEEAELPYQVRLIDAADQQRPDYLAQQPFGQVPVLQDGELTLFESGAIVLHIGARSERLLPADAARRARAVTWLLAALNTIEVPVSELADIDLFHAGEAWTAERRPQVEQALHQRLAQLAAQLGERPWLDGDFSAGDLMMTTVLRSLRHTRIVEDYPNLHAYQLRNEARPAFQRALDGQMAVFAAHPFVM